MEDTENRTRDGKFLRCCFSTKLIPRANLFYFIFNLEFQVLKRCSTADCQYCKKSVPLTSYVAIV